jgi:hypothetical protein
MAKYVEKLLNAQGPAVNPAADGAQS